MPAPRDPHPRDLDVVGIGGMVVDRIHRTPRLATSDEKVTLRALDDGTSVQRCVGGVVLNGLGWATVLGLRTGIFGRLADDDNGRFLRAAMDGLGIERHLASEGVSSSYAEIFVDDAGGRAVYMDPGTTAGTHAAHVREVHAEFVARAAWLDTEISQLPLDAVLAGVELAREAGVSSVLDVDVPIADALATLGDEATLFAILEAADVLKLSTSAAREFAPDAGADALALAARLRARFGGRAVVVTDGEHGCAIGADGFEARIAVERVPAVDTTGCGDAFRGGLLAAMRGGLDWESAGRLANACGAACAEQLGAFPEDPEAARQRVRARYPGPPWGVNETRAR